MPALGHGDHEVVHIIALDTIGIGRSVNAEKPSVKRARWTVYRQRLLCQIIFIGHSAKQLVLGKEKRPSRYRVTASGFTECLSTCTRQRIPNGSICQVLCRVLCVALGKACLFVECQGHNTRQRSDISAQALLLCRVLWLWHSAKHLFAKWPVYTFFICFSYYIQTNKRYHIYITYITYIHHRYHHRHKYLTQI
jgi:hypothetical protein